jgi:hypothetical protein
MYDKASARLSGIHVGVTLELTEKVIFSEAIRYVNRVGQIFEFWLGSGAPCQTPHLER